MLKDRVSRQLDQLRKESKDVERARAKPKLDLWLSEIEDTIHVALGKDAALVKEARKLQDQEEFNKSTIASATQLIDRAKKACRLAMLANGRDDLAEYVRILVNDTYTQSRWLYLQVGMLFITMAIAFGGVVSISGQTIDFRQTARERRGELEDEVNRFKASAQTRLNATLNPFEERTNHAEKKLNEIENAIDDSVAQAGKQARRRLDGELKDLTERASQAVDRLGELERTVGDRIQQAVNAEAARAGVDIKLATVNKELEYLQSLIRKGEDRIQNGEERITGFIEDLSATKHDVQSVSQEAPAILARLAPIGKLDDRLQRVEQIAGFRWWDSVIGLTALSGLVLVTWMYWRKVLSAQNAGRA